ncbi:MAG TPA: ligase-associated DNA damage response endonuclease PdeM [Hyphomicrobiaceae bacterium]|nr:ligase-associated DNA damage response endonuclease PdeM [Hyphomicrobiaceae bacterium]
MLELKPERLDVGDFNEQPLSICGKAFVADFAGALYWPAEDALIVADLHLEKGSAHASRGLMLPPYDTRDTLERLAAAIDRFDATTVIALGDSLHDCAGAERISAEDLETLRIMQDDREWIWVTGNHDPRISSRLGGHVVDELRVAGLVLRHMPAAAAVTHEIAGHMHPAAKLALYGYAIRRPCFVGNGVRLVLPAFGTYAGGLNVLDEAFTPLFGNDGLCVWMLGQEGLYPVATRLLKED